MIGLVRSPSPNPTGEMESVLAVAAGKASRYTQAPWRFLTSGLLAGAGIAFIQLAAVPVRGALASIAPGLENMVMPALVAAGLSLLVLVARLDVSTGTAAHLAVARLEHRMGAARCLAVIVSCVAANLVGAVAFTVAMAWAGMLDRIRQPLTDLGTARMLVPAWRMVMQGILAGWWLGTIAVVGSASPGPRWRGRIVAWGYFLFVAIGFRLATAESCLHSAVWAIGALPGTRPMAVVAQVLTVTIGNTLGAAALGGGLVWLAKDGGQRAQPPHRTPAGSLVRRHLPGVRMDPAIVRVDGSLRRPTPPLP